MLYAIAVVLVLIADQGSKYLTTLHIAVNVGEKKVIPGLLHLTNVHNYGAAFSILQNARWLFIVITLLFVVVVIFVLVKGFVRAPLGRWSLCMILAGAVGNGIDRCLLGYVVDMFELDFVKFPVFNVADIFITVFGIVFCVYILFGKDNADQKRPQRAGGGRDSAMELEREAKPSRRSRSEREHERETAMAELEKRRTERLQRQFPPPWQPQPDNPFAEWSDSGENPARQTPPQRQAVHKQDPRRVAPVLDSRYAADDDEVKVYDPHQKQPHRPAERPQPEPVRYTPVSESNPQPVKARPAETPPQPPARASQPKPAQKKPANDMDFSLEDILAEFSDK